MQNFVPTYERFLRIDDNDDVGVVLRARALYCFGWLFVALQGLNIVGMNATVGAWSNDHWIAVGAAGAVFAAIHGLRYYKNFTVYALFITSLYLVGNAGTALPDGTGINTSLLPFIVIIPMLNGFIAGPRMALLSGALSLGFIFVLFKGSAISATDAAEVGIITQRALQAGFAISLVSIIAATFSENTFHAFHLLESNVRRARRAESAKMAFLAAMSHELRTPLNGVLGLTEAMRRTDLDQEQFQLMNTIDRSGRSLLVILNDILDLSKIDAKKLQINPVAFNPRELMDDVADMWRETAGAKGLDVTVQIDPAMPDHIVGDDLRIRQIVSNIVSNAVKFTEQGSITITAQCDTSPQGEPHLAITVTDTGDGIPECAQARIFNPFEQAESGITRRHGGTGLGLAICQNLARLMRGTIDLDTQMGVGSAFRLTVPFTPAPFPPVPVSAEMGPPAAPAASRTPSAAVAEAERAPASAPGGAPTADQAGLNGLRVLLVEDNHVNQVVAGHFLHAMGIDFDVAENGAVGLDCLAKDKYDVILMDKHMPVMNGVQATKAIRRLDTPVAAIPIIACTADALTGEEEALRLVGFSDFIAKPIDLEGLRKIIARNIAPKAAEEAA